MTTAVAPTAITTMRFVPQRDLVLDHKNWVNPRTVTGLDDQSIAELAADIKARGIQVPLIVQKIKTHNGGFTNLVLEGQRRALAATEVLAKDAEIPVVDRTVEPIDLTPEAADELMLDMLSVATKRDGLSSYELSEVAERLRKRERTLAEISKAIGRSEGWISKILKARSTATPKLMLKWRKGEVTDEQFKELAEVKEPERQAEAVAEVVKARKSGDLAEARVRSKELAEGEKTKRDDKDNDDAPRVVKGPQQPLFKDDVVKPPVVRKPMTSRIALEDVVALTKRRPPTHDYVKGIMDGIRYALGDSAPDEWARPWQAYLDRVEGKPTRAKSKARSTKAKKGKTKKRGK